jgi:hypothetical protein
VRAGGDGVAVGVTESAECERVESVAGRGVDSRGAVPALVTCRSAAARRRLIDLVYGT